MTVILPPPPSEKEKKKYIDLPPPPSSSSLPVPTQKEKEGYIQDIGQLPAPSETPLEKEIRDRGFFDRPALESEVIKASEIQEIANKYGVSAEDLRDALPFLGGVPEEGYSFTDALKKGAGFLAEGVTLGVPQKIYKMVQDPQMEKALDDLSDLAHGRQSAVSLGAEMLLPGGLIGRGAKSVGRALAAGAATGVVAGAAGARSGQEGQGALFGSVLGGGAGAVSQKLANRAIRSGNKAEARLIEDVTQKQRVDLEEGTQAVLKARQGAEEELEALVLKGKSLDDLSGEDLHRVARDIHGEESLSKMLDPSTEEGALLRKSIAREASEDVSELGPDRAIIKRSVERAAEERAKDFAEALTGKRPKGLEEAREAISEVASRQGREAIEKRYRLLVEEEAAKDYIRKAAVRGGREGTFTERTANFLSDAQFVIRDIDDRLGTALEPVHRALNEAYNRMSFPRLDMSRKLSDIFKKHKDIDTIITDTDRVYKALDTGNMAGLSSKEMRAVQDFRKFFDEGLEFVNSTVKSRDPDISPLSIPKRENYVPHMTKDTEELVREFSKRVGEVKDLASRSLGRRVTDFSELSDKEFRALQSTPALKEILQGLSVVSKKGETPTSGPELSALLKDAFATRDGRSRLETMARAALERHDAIPEWMREKNLYKLASRWSGNTLKHLYLREHIDRMSSMARRLDKMGADVEATYIRNLLADIQGVRKGTAAEQTLQARIRYQSALDKIADKHGDNPLVKGALAVAKAVPEILSDLSKQIYPNLLGLSPRALIMNSTQIWAKTAPELGSAYGYTTVLRGTIHAVLNLRRQVKKIQELGFAPADFVSKYSRATADGIRRGSTYAIPSQVLQSMGEASMWLYTKMDMVNRAIATSTAEMMAYDLSKGSKAAQKALGKFPPTVQKQVARAGSDQEKVAQILGSHLNSSTQYNYNRMSMSEYGRTMGPLFSTFSKWPTATAGEIIQEVRDKGLVKGSRRNAEKYVVPFVLFQAVDYLLGASDPEEMSDRKKKTLGYGGISQSAPIGSVEGMLKGDFFTPPVIDAVLQGAIVPLLAGDEAGLRKGLATSIQNFTPGSVYVRFVTDDLLTLISGERPEGSDFLERTQEGTRRLTR